MPKINNIPKPILKWVGGKTQIIDSIISKFPNEINNYREIFLGGGSVLFALLYYIKNNYIKIKGNIFAYDINEALINVYKNIQNNHIELYDCIQNIIKDFNECKNDDINRNPENIEEAKKSKENFYYWIRNKYNNLTDKNNIISSAMFIFLNKTCFRGIFRIGPNGFNVPYGNYKNPEIINKNHLEEIHNLIQNVIFECCDYSISLTNIEIDDFIFLDPPYVPEIKTSFVGYTKDGFNLNNHMNLFKIIENLTNENRKLMLCNSDIDLVHETFNNYNIIEILCKRTINSKNPNAKTKELIIMNY